MMVSLRPVFECTLYPSAFQNTCLTSPEVVPGGETLEVAPSHHHLNIFLLLKRSSSSPSSDHKASPCNPSIGK